MDQVPLPFICRMSKRTHGRKHDSGGRSLPAWEKVPKTSGLDKRQATLQPTLFPAGEQVVPLLLILRGLGKALHAGEIEAYRRAKDKGVRVLFQPKAWADSWIMMHWLLDIFIPSVRAAGKKGWIMLGLDNHGCHTHPAFKAACAEHHIFLVFTPV